MACYHPLKAFVIGTYINSKGEEKHRLKITPWSIDGNEVAQVEYDPKMAEWFPRVKGSGSLGCTKSSFISYEIPCGQCIGCRLERSRQWANRLMMEFKDHDPDECWFLTLTYDNDHLETILSANSETGEATLSLCKRDLVLFNKRLREKFPLKNIRFYAAGEYGENTFRPHYHGIYFSLVLDGFDSHDRRNVWCRTEQGFVLYHWPVLDSVWGKGNVLFSRVSWDTCAYVARYVTKKLSGSAAEKYDLLGIEPEFSLMSRRPGIARNFFDNIDDFDPTKRIYISTPDGGKNFLPPRYFKSIWAIDNQLEYGIMTIDSARNLALKRELIRSQNDLARQDFEKYLLTIEESHERGASKLLRDAF